MKVFSESLVEEARVASRVADLSQATIGEVLLVAQYLERKTGIPFIRMDQGSPGLPPNAYGVAAEKEALDRGVGSQYPPADGIPELKKAASRFIKAFVDVDVDPAGCIPTTGSVAGSFGAFIAYRRLGHYASIAPTYDTIRHGEKGVEFGVDYVIAKNVMATAKYFLGKKMPDEDGVGEHLQSAKTFYGELSFFF